MARIEQLPPHVVNKIAAGEVIERPASVVKELMENAVDAESKRIDVVVEQGGMAQVRIADDGTGIPAEQLPLAVTSHATSKLRDAEDLFRVHTLGFRGEALASIASVSHLRIRSRTSDDQAGAELEVHGGQPDEVAPCGCPVGTVVEVRQLFYNTPVRRKYLRTTQTELGHASEAFTRVALAHPQIHFTFTHQGRSVYDLPPADSWRERIAVFFGQELSESLLWVENEHAGIQLRGYVANPSQSRANNRMQYLLLNGRFIRDRSLQHALSEAYRGLLMTGRYPIAFLRLTMPPDAVDVNVHPTKLEVRFQDGGRVYSQLLGTLRSRFLSTDLTAQVRSPSSDESPTPSTADPRHMDQHRAELEAWARGVADGQPPEATRNAQRELPLPELGAAGSVPPFRPFDASAKSQASADADREPAQAPSTDDSDPSLAGASTRPAGLQMHNRYLVTENAEGLVVIDQHALHERVLYEQLREKVLAGNMETQRLLVPETVSLTPTETSAVLEARETLRQLGMEVEPFGGDTLLISAYPAMLANLSPHEILRQVVDLLLAEGKSSVRRDLLDDLLNMVACKAAIKAGDRLSPEEVNALLQQRHLFQDTHHCPHGRPTALVFSREELDRRFKR
jgi:DNA mismatch repair protein MutL